VILRAALTQLLAEKLLSALRERMTAWQWEEEETELLRRLGNVALFSATTLGRASHYSCVPLLSINSALLFALRHAEHDRTAACTP